MSNPNPKISIGCPNCKGSLYVLADFCHYCKSPLPEVIISELIKIQTQKKMGGVMSNQDPLNSSDQGKLLIFSLLMVPSIVFLVGVIPTIFLAFGIYMMKKNQDFSSIDTAVTYFKNYFKFLKNVLRICGIICLILVAWIAVGDAWPADGIELVAPPTAALLGFGISIAYLKAVNNLFYKLLKRHSEWVAVNGIFSTKPKSATKPAIESEVDIIKGEKLKQYSVAYELMKWAKLKEEGHISEDEFNKARDKLLNRKEKND